MEADGALDECQGLVVPLDVDILKVGVGACTTRGDVLGCLDCTDGGGDRDDRGLSCCSRLQCDMDV